MNCIYTIPFLLQRFPVFAGWLVDLDDLDSDFVVLFSCFFFLRFSVFGQPQIHLRHLSPPKHKQSKKGSSGWVRYTILGLGWGGFQGLQLIRTLMHLHHPGRWGWEWPQDAALIRTPRSHSRLKRRLSQMGLRRFWVDNPIRGWGTEGYHDNLSLSSGESSHCGGRCCTIIPM